MKVNNTMFSYAFNVLYVYESVLFYFICICVPVHIQGGRKIYAISRNGKLPTYHNSVTLAVIHIRKSGLVNNRITLKGAIGNATRSVMSADVV